MNILKGGLIFVAGAAAGAVPMWFYMKKKVDEANEATQQAVDNVKASYEQSEKNQEMKKSLTEASPEDWSYVPSSIFSSSLYEEKEEPHEDIRQITAEEFESDEDTKMFLTYYKLDDLVVYSDTMVPIDEPEELLGEDFRDIFKDDDVVYIENEKEGAQYEVLIDEANTITELVTEDPEVSNVFDTVESEPIAEGGE